MKLTADQYYNYVYFCMLEEPAIYFHIRQPLVFSTDNASFKAKNIRAGNPDLFMSTVLTTLLTCLRPYGN